MGLLLKHLRSVLSDFSSDQEARLIVNAYNDEGVPHPRNRRARTCLMVKGLRDTAFAAHGLVPQAALRAFPPDADDESSFERYTDFAIYAREWYSGKRFCKLAVEVENSWNELKGTIKDLLSFQAQNKWAVFYHDLDGNKIENVKTELVDAIRTAWTALAQDGFCESRETKYEIIVLPEKISESSLKQLRVVEAVFSSGDWKTRALPVDVLL